MEKQKIQIYFGQSKITFVEIDHEMISTAILLLLLIQNGQLSVTDQSMCTITG